ncbi:MAG: HD domain-containing phosphohydrolase [Planctomycetota bacterium]
MSVKELPKLLCVDDEPNVLSSLSRGLRGHFRVKTATSGLKGLKILEEEGPFAVVMSDMRMPVMDGAKFLSRVREAQPDTVRILLTGHADRDAAIAAVNEGQIFRFLSKPCPPTTLLKALKAAARQYELVSTERILLEQTLRGSVKALTDILALANPEAFGRATRAKRHVEQILGRFAIENRWQVEVAAMLSEIGCVILPPDVVQHLYYGEELSDEEQAMLGRASEVTQKILANIPRLEEVAEILKYKDKRYDGSGFPEDSVQGDKIPWGARVLKVAFDFEMLESRGIDAEAAKNTLRRRRGWYDREILEALPAVGQAAVTEEGPRKVTVEDIVPGMLIESDVITSKGMLVIGRGQEATEGLIVRMRNYKTRIGIREPILVSRPDKQPVAQA